MGMERGGMQATSSTSWQWDESMEDQQQALQPTDEQEHPDPSQDLTEQDPVPTWAWSHQLLGKELDQPAGVTKIRIGASLRTDILLSPLCRIVRTTYDAFFLPML